MADKSNAEVVAGEIVSYLFDDYPDNNQVRGDAIAEVAKRITTAQSQLAEKVLAVVGDDYAERQVRDLFTRLGIPTEGA